MITEREFPANGDFEVTLKGETPAAVMDEVRRAFWGLLVVTDAPVDPHAVNALFPSTYSNGTVDSGDPSPYVTENLPRYSGVFLKRLRPNRAGNVPLRGLGLASLWGDDNYGQLIDEYRNFPLDASFPSGVTPNTVFYWMTNGDGDGISPGPMNGRYWFLPATSYAEQYFGNLGAQRLSRMTVLSKLPTMFPNTAIRIWPNAQVDGGERERLFPEPAIVTVIKSEGGRDSATHALTAADLTVEEDLSTYAHHVILENGGSFPAEVTAPTAVYDPQGNPLELVRRVERTDVSDEQLGAFAQEEFYDATNLRREIKVSTDQHDGLDDVVVGQDLNVYDPSLGLYDTSNPMWANGQIWPEKIRCVSKSWPITQGLGVYLRWFDGDVMQVTDLTPYVVWGDGPTTFEVEKATRPLIPQVPNQLQTGFNIQVIDPTGIGEA